MLNISPAMRSRYTLMWVAGPSTEDIRARFNSLVQQGAADISAAQLSQLSAALETTNPRDFFASDLWADCFLAQYRLLNNFGRALIATIHILTPRESLAALLASIKFNFTNEVAAMVTALSQPIPASVSHYSICYSCSLMLRRAF